MTVYVWKYAPDANTGGLLPLKIEPQPATLDEASLRLPGGAYTTFRTYQSNCALRLEDHLLRLEETARLAGCAVALDAGDLRAGLRRLVQERPPGVETRFRLTVDLETQVGEVYIAAEPLKTPPPLAYTEGVRVVTTGLQRLLPKAKLTRFISRAGLVRQSLPPDVEEAVMVNAQGFVLEGLSSNFLAIRSATLWTADDGVLSGITRGLALEAAYRLGFPVRLEGLQIAALPECEEAFITSSSRGILPVVRVDAQIVGEGVPGPITLQLAAEFERLIGESVKPI